MKHVLNNKLEFLNEKKNTQPIQLKAFFSPNVISALMLTTSLVIDEFVRIHPLTSIEFDFHFSFRLLSMK